MIAPMRARLIKHPSSGHGVVASVEVELRRVAAARLQLRFELHAALDRLRIPAAANAARVPGLWEHTCFEAFVARGGTADYLEFNFSPSGEWAAYAFTAYRQGMRDLELPRAPRIALQSCVTATHEAPLVMDVELSLPPDWGNVDGRLALCAVIEDADGLRSYWALHHASAQPDFHHPESFTLRLDEI